MSYLPNKQYWNDLLDAMNDWVQQTSELKWQFKSYEDFKIKD
jgi:hypothetical protein